MISRDVLSLGIRFITDDIAGSMQRGRIYGLEARVPSIRFPLVAATIQAALETGIPCTIVLRSKPEAYLAQINTPQRMDVDATLASSALGVLVMRDDFGKRMFQMGAARFTHELTGFGVPPGSLVIFEHASEMLNLRDKGLATQQIDAIGAWCLERDCTGLLVFSGSPERNTVPVTDFLDTLAGFAALDISRGQLSIDFPYWQCHGQVSSCHHLALQLDKSGSYGVTHAGVAHPGPSRFSEPRTSALGASGPLASGLLASEPRLMADGTAQGSASATAALPSSPLPSDVKIGLPPVGTSSGRPLRSFEGRAVSVRQMGASQLLRSAREATRAESVAAPEHGQ
jgi:hypothetical protein